MTTFVDQEIEIKLLLSMIKERSEMKFINLYNSLSYQFRTKGFLTQPQLTLLRNTAFNNIDYTPKEQYILNKMPVYCRYGN